MSAVICSPSARAASTMRMTVSSLCQLAEPVALRWKISAAHGGRAYEGRHVGRDAARRQVLQSLAERRPGHPGLHAGCVCLAVRPAVQTAPTLDLRAHLVVQWAQRNPFAEDLQRDSLAHV